MHLHLQEEGGAIRIAWLHQMFQRGVVVSSYDVFLSRLPGSCISCEFLYDQPIIKLGQGLLLRVLYVWNSGFDFTPAS